MTPIDDAPMPPPPSGKKDADYLTQDIVSALDRAVVARVDAVAKEHSIGRRAAAAIVLRQIQEMR
jgi:hypothetical protein